MRIFTTLLLCFLTSVMSHAQVRNSMSYKFEARDQYNEIISEQGIGVKISIMKSPTSRSVVYIETHVSEADIDGIVSLRIGTGTPFDPNVAAYDDKDKDKDENENADDEVNEDEDAVQEIVVQTEKFASINWKAAPYYIKIEIDPEGGDNYRVKTINQLMRVPFASEAVYAKTAYYASRAGNVFSGNYKDLKNKPVLTYYFADKDGDGFGDPYSAINAHQLPEGFVENDTDCDDDNPSVYPNSPEIIGNGIDEDCVGYDIGMYAKGGVIFYIFKEGEKGYKDGEFHGLVCSIIDLGKASWGCKGVRLYDSDELGSTFGSKNSKNIINNCAEASTAVRKCASYSVTLAGNKYKDWFLPSKNELNEMYLQKDIISITSQANGGQKFKYAWYWSSSEHSKRSASWQDFNNGIQSYHRKSGALGVRAVRQF